MRLIASLVAIYVVICIITYLETTGEISWWTD
jgi:hypothetical protein